MSNLFRKGYTGGLAENKNCHGCSKACPYHNAVSSSSDKLYKRDNETMTDNAPPVSLRYACNSLRRFL
jgi:hypothetical protein